jgi:hypothetical protein
VKDIWTIAIACTVAATACGTEPSKSDGDDKAVPAVSATKPAPPAEKPAELPKGYNEKIEAATLADAAKWARAKPENVYGRKAMHIPGGGKTLFANGRMAIMTSSYEVPLNKVVAGLLVLLADDGYEVSDVKRDGPEKLSFLISPKGVHDGPPLGALAVLGSVPGQAATMGSLSLAFGQPDETVGDAPRNLVGTPVKAHWEYNGQMFAGKITKVYGKYAKINFNDGDVGWDALEALAPAFKPDPDPKDECAFKVGDKVNARWSKQKMSGTVDKTYFGLAHIKFSDGNKGWDECKAMSAKK